MGTVKNKMSKNKSKWYEPYKIVTTFDKGEIKKRIEEALLADDRIKAVTDFKFGGKKGELEVKFKVHTIFGTLEIERTVDI